LTDFDKPEIYRSVLEVLPTGVYLVDRSRRILFWNAGAESICGYLRQDVVGRFLREHLLATTDGGDDYDPLNLVLREGKSSTAHVSILHKEGYRVPIVLQTVPIRNEHGNIIGAAECFEGNVAASERTRRKTGTGGLVGLDEVTGLASRLSMEGYIRDRLALFEERRAEFGILLIQVDHMDDLRAARGPGVVPSVLRVAAHTIENSLRPGDELGAWSDNRFVAVLEDCRETDLANVGNRVRKMIGQSEVEWWGDRFAVTAALGGTGCRTGDTWESLLERAERSLVESAEAGGNRFTAAP
jgi:diguanylate cyclase (GGDEF)-like protein/PAS domain S-box-containing protein